MARLLKPQKVDSIYDNRTRMTIDLWLNRNENTFFATVGTDEIKAAAIHELKEKVRGHLARMDVDVVWSRFIYLHVREPNDSSWPSRKNTTREIEFSFRRMEVATITGFQSRPRRVERPFDEDIEDAARESRKRNPLWDVDTCHDDEADLFPYTEELWASVNSIADGLERARERLTKLCDPADKGAALLAAGKARLLGDGKA